MDGVHPPRLCAVWNGGGVCCYWSTQPSACGLHHILPVHTVSTAQSCRVLFLVGSCTVRVVSVSPLSLCGGVSSVHPPLVVVVVGAIVDGGACVVVVGGVTSEGRWCY